MSVSVQQLGRQAALLHYKQASSRLRALAKVVRVLKGGKSPGGYLLQLMGKPIGYLTTNSLPGGAVGINNSYILPKFRGMGLGKKMYGEAMRNLPPGKTLYSDYQVSEDAKRIWEGFGRRKNPWLIQRAEGVAAAYPHGATAEGLHTGFGSGALGVYSAKAPNLPKFLRGGAMETIPADQEHLYAMFGK